jgi:hypothetical protein
VSACLLDAFSRELRQGAEFAADRRLDEAFRHFERAHVLGQRRTLLHLRAHRAMLGVGVARRDFREVAGQLSRMLAALLFSRIWVPVGNTGGANVSAFSRMPIPADLQAILDDDS